MSLGLVFMGTPDFAVPVLDAVSAAGHRILSVYSQPPRPAGRGMADAKSPVHKRAEDLSIPVLTPVNFKADSDRQAFAALKADAAVVVAYGLLLPQAVLEAPRLGCYNVHASKLPRWRGAAPIQRAIMAGDTLTAVNVMRMEAGLDTGPVCLGRDIPIPPQMTGGQLHNALSKAGADLMVEALAKLQAGQLTQRPQALDGITYAAKLDKRELRIDFTRDAGSVVNHIRALSPSPGAWFEIAIGDASTAKIERIKVLKASKIEGRGEPGVVMNDRLTIACGRDAIAIHELQRAGRKATGLDEFLRGCRIACGARVQAS